jgi:hypothetical protein
VKWDVLYCDKYNRFHTQTKQLVHLPLYFNLQFLDRGQKYKKFFVGASISQDQATLNSITNVISMCNFHPQNREVVKRTGYKKEGIPIRLNVLEIENKYQKHIYRHK